VITVTQPEFPNPQTLLHSQRHNEVREPARIPPERTRTDNPVRIAMLAPPWIPIPPPGYGGIEYVVALLCDALAERGNDVELFCAPGSHSKATVRPLLPSAHPEAIERSLFEADHVGRAFDLFDEAAANGTPFDIIHNHCGYTPLAMADRQSLPLVHTVHGPFDRDSSVFYDAHGSKGGLICISQSQAADAPPGANVVAVVHNPIDVDAWPFRYQSRTTCSGSAGSFPRKGRNVRSRSRKQRGDGSCSPVSCNPATSSSSRARSRRTSTAVTSSTSARSGARGSSRSSPTHSRS
jgi:hypothetical protein